MKQLLSFYVLLCGLSLFAQKQKQLDALAVEFTQKSLPLFKEVLSIPNDAFYPDWIEQNVQWSEKNFAQRGFTTARISTKAAPLLLASRSFPNAKKTVLVYLQMDGQPVDPSRWAQDDPYQPVVKKQNPEAFTCAMERVPKATLMYYKNHREFWKRFQSPLEDWSKIFYDQYLKSNQQTDRILHQF